MGEDPDDRAIREAHGFAYEDDWQDRSLLCRNGCGLTYPDISAGKIRECSAAAGPADGQDAGEHQGDDSGYVTVTPEEFGEFTRRHGVRWEEL